LVGPNGEQVGIVRVEDALRLAAEADLDLVEVAPMAKPPVAKLMDFGKFKYEAAMKAREARKNQVNTVIKEIKLRPKIDPHDYGTKKGHVERFLKGGDKVKVTIMFRGREQSRPELGYRLLQRLAQDILELGTVESAPKQDGRNMVMVIAPTKKKAQAMAEQRRRRDEGGNASASANTSASAGSSAAVDSIEAEVLQAQAFEAEAVETEAVEATAPEVEVVEEAAPEVEVVEEAAPEPEVVETPAPVAAVVETPVETKPSAAPKPTAAPAPKAPAPKATPKPRAAPKPKA
jgi:translation initiation factor IF-3